MSSDLVEALREQEAAWRERPLVRRLYREWHALIRERLAHLDGPTIELGSGFGALAESIPDVVRTDVAETPWAAAVVDAEDLPYADGSVANLVLIDVFHHLARPRHFLDEARRVLPAGGRLIVLDPYCSPVSTIAYKAFHRERTDLGGAVLDDDPAVAHSPFDSNQARATLVFFRHVDRFEDAWPDLRVVERRRLACIAYPLSGGFAGRRLAPDAAHVVLAWLERIAQPLAPLLAFRCLVVVERIKQPSHS